MFLHVLGHIGLTAWAGIVEVGRLQAGETLVVTAAAGAVGSLAGQIGKILGARVVGISGTREKCGWLTGELGFDAAVNYRTEPVRVRLRELCPRGIDVQFENVGGEMLEAGLANLALHGRVALCGLISQYTATSRPAGAPNIDQLIVKRGRIEGFLVSDYMGRSREAFAALGRWLAEGRLKARLTIVDGLEHAPTALNRLFDGSHDGKLVVRL
jgi:NADPH-dependent curcumin reductase CurA